MAAGDDSRVGHGLESCTREIEMVKVNDVILVDTPGFDGTHKTDREILTMIADWLAVT
jgi:predicted GTPase